MLARLSSRLSIVTVAKRTRVSKSEEESRRTIEREKRSPRWGVQSAGAPHSRVQREESRGACVSCKAIMSRLSVRRKRKRLRRRRSERIPATLKVATRRGRERHREWVGVLVIIKTGINNGGGGGVLIGCESGSASRAC